MDIELEINKEVNFLMVVYQILKKQQSFENLNFNLPENLESKELRSFIKSLLRSGNFFLDNINDNSVLNEIYLNNKDTFDIYWKNNFERLDLIRKKLKQNLNDFNLNVFDKVGRFFFKDPVKKIKIFICMGNVTPIGSGNAFSPNIAVVFPRKFESFDEKSLENDFAVLIHEIVHLCQNMCDEDDKELLENVTRCFAPRGILINEEKRGETEVNEFYNLLKEFFLKDKDFMSFKREYKSLKT